MNKPLLIETVYVTGPLRLETTWSDGKSMDIDFALVLARAKPEAPIQALHNPAIFERVAVAEWGHGLDWPDGLSMDADRLRDIAVEQDGGASGQFAAWMARHQLSPCSAAEALGTTRYMVTRYRTGSRPVPRTVLLACKGWEAERSEEATK